MPSNIIFIFSDLIFIINLAAKSPNKNVKTIDTSAVFKEINIGDISILFSYLFDVKP
ncbi:hypothetical protein SDC9_47612 [bioreactor metagenome]|uniref:Uncharacterized protein n=1 Tax=bioreactor metagenome TaxID=1076179 RepID=A0A644WC98_9ZZZZ